MLAAPASAQTTDRKLNLQIRNIDATNSCSTANFRPELKITNYGSQAVVLTHSVVRMFFNNPRTEFIEFVNAGPLSVHNADGSPTGTYGQAFHFEGPPPSPACSYTPARKANQTHFIAFQSPTYQFIMVPPNGGYATVTVSLRRGGGKSPFDSGCDDFTKLVSENPNRPYQDDIFFNLVENNPRGAPYKLICEYVNASTVDPFTGIDPCTNTNACSPP